MGGSGRRVERRLTQFTGTGTVIVMGWWIIMVISILQWNARSLVANGQEFKKFVSSMQDKPNIICIQETWLRAQWDFIIQGYTAIRNDRMMGKGGGVAIFVRKVQYCSIRERMRVRNNKDLDREI